MDDPAAFAPGGWTNTVCVLDADGDGFTDLVVGNPARLLHNDGSGRFDDVSGNLPAGIMGPVVAGDLDGDGAVDLVAGSSGSSLGQVHLFHNDGAGRFSFAGELIPGFLTEFVAGLALGDIDGDGDLDVLAALRGRWTPGQMVLFVNQGAGVFTTATTLLPATTESGYAVRFVDVDGDGDLDIVRTDSGVTRLLINNGAGSFTDQTATRMPPHPGELPFALGSGDIDGDGDVDLVLGLNVVHVLQNNGAGVFTDVTATAMPQQASLLGIDVGDLDGDGDLDLATANADFTTTSGLAQNHVYLNNGSGQFTDAPIVPVFSDYSWAIAAVDLDRDGDVDLVIAGSAGARVLQNARRHVLAPPRVRIGTPAQIGWFAAETGTVRYLAAAASLALLPQPVLVGGFGWLSVAQPMAALNGQLLVGTADSFTNTLAVPAAPALVGTALHFQGVVLNLSNPAGTGLTNRSSMVAVQ